MYRPIFGIIAAAIGLVAALAGAWWLWWRLPKRQAGQLRLTIRDPKARADLEDSFRKTIGQLLGGAAVLIGAGFAYLQFSQQQQASHELLISNQVAKGFEQLASDKEVVRLGGIYALEGEMNTSEGYHKPVLEALSAFVRDGTRTATGDDPPATDIQAALIVMGRRKTIGTETADFARGPPDLAHAHIPHADLFGANLNSAHLTGADLSHANLVAANLGGRAMLDGANLNFARLPDADLSQSFSIGANLSRADLNNANLSGAVLGSANLSGVQGFNSNLSRAILSGANLSGAHLLVANLSGANLTEANLTGADLHGANLRDANLWGADLRGALVTQEQLDEACGTNAKLDPGLKLEACSNRGKGAGPSLVPPHPSAVETAPLGGQR